MKQFVRCGVLAVLASAVSGQDATLSPVHALPRLRVPIHTAGADQGQSYGIWAAGADYKVSFHDGMTFVPYLGPDYPVNRPWSWRTTAVVVGGDRVVGPDRAGEPRQLEYRYEYDLGGVVEAYDVRREGLEQTFVLPAALGRGDLEIRGRVTSSLGMPVAAAAHQALTFHDSAGVAILEYGAAWVIDAAGRKLAITTAVEDREIVLRVPAAWLDEARYPVTVDPLLTPVTVVTGGMFLVSRVDLAHDDESGQDNTMFVFDRNTSSSDTDVYGYLADGDLTGAQTIFADITTSWDAYDASCAFVGGADQWAVVFRRQFSNGTPERSLLRSHLHPRGSTSYTTGVGFLATPSPFNDAAPEVGGCAAGSSRTHAVVLFEREDNGATGGDYRRTNRTQVLYSLLDCTAGNGTFGAVQLLGGGGSTDCEHPAVTDGAGNGEDWLAAFAIMLPGTGATDWEVRARRIDASGAAASQLWSSPRSTDNSVHEFSPAVGGRGGRYAISFTAGFGSGAQYAPFSGREGWVQRVEWPVGSMTVPASMPPVLLVDEPFSQMRSSAIAFDTNDRSHFVAAWWIGLAPTAGAYASKLGFDGLVTEGPLALSPNSWLDAPNCVFDATTGDFLLTWGGDQDLPGRVLAPPAAAAPTQSPSACSNATVRWNGSQQIGSQFGRVVGKKPGGTNGTLHFLVVSLATANQPITIPGVVPGCDLLIDNVNGYLGPLGLRLGKTVSWDFPLPSWLASTTFHFQDWILDGPEFEASERLSVPTVR